MEGEIRPEVRPGYHSRLSQTKRPVIGARSQSPSLKLDVFPAGVRVARVSTAAEQCTVQRPQALITRKHNVHRLTTITQLQQERYWVEIVSRGFHFLKPIVTALRA